MKRLAYAWLALGLLLAASAARAAPHRLPEPIHTRQTAFSIPFQVDQAVELPVEIELYVSGDAGRSWQRYASTTPDKRSFVFRAAEDGEYWFRLRTLNRDGRRYPEGEAPPELRVVIDTLQPQIELEAQQGPSGEIVVRWKMRDHWLEPETLKLEYRCEEIDTAWQSVAVDEVRHRSDGESLVGTTTFWPATNEYLPLVRVEVADAAGNRGTTQVRLQGRPRAESNASAQVAVRPRQPASTSPPDANRLWPADEVASRPLPTEASEGEAISAPDAESAIAVAMDSPVEAVEPPVGRRVTPKIPTAGPTSAAVEAPAGNPEPLPEPTGAETAASGWSDESTSGDEADGFTFDTSPLGPDEPLRIVNSRRFELEYEIEALAGSTPTKVELWGTRDGGQSWSSYAIDDDQQSPLVVTVEGEGVYGFRITVETQSGLGSLPPKSGDAPDVWLGVDLTPPFARLIAAEPRARGSGHELVIRWEARDERLAAAPIALAFAHRPTGPWQPLATALENTGEYVWPLDSRLPEALYLRLEVRDEAGNVQRIDAREPVSLERLRPQGRIRNVRPAQ